MKYRLYILILSIILIQGCTPDKRPTGETASEPETKPEAVKQDTSFLAKQQIAAKAKLAERYDQKEVIDTVLNVNGKEVQVNYEYYCLKDSSLIIPSDYYELGGDFNTYEFASKLTLSSDNQTLFDGVITKQIFKDVLTDELLSYGTLLFPSFRGLTSDSTEISIHYSVTVPSTDIGSGVNIYFDENGGYRVSN